MTDLIARIESADGPDRELDWAIHMRDGLLGVGMYGDHPLYTASIDAALTLVPVCHYMHVYTPYGEVLQGYAVVSDRDDGPLFTSIAATPALALAAAALKARGAV